MLKQKVGEILSNAVAGGKVLEGVTGGWGVVNAIRHCICKLAMISVRFLPSYRDWKIGILSF